MLRLDKSSNRIAKLKPVRFSDFGFDDTKERLDLLTLDKRDTNHHRKQT